MIESVESWIRLGNPAKPVNDALETDFYQKTILRFVRTGALLPLRCDFLGVFLKEPSIVSDSNAHRNCVESATGHS